MHFKDCKLIQVDFTGTDLTEARFESCDLLDAIFEQTTLRVPI